MTLCVRLRVKVVVDGDKGVKQQARLEVKSEFKGNQPRVRGTEPCHAHPYLVPHLPTDHFIGGTMSSAAARAEARRKAILARGSDRLSRLTTSARGEDAPQFVHDGMYFPDYT